MDEDVRVRHLRSFVAVAEQRHFGRAAQQLGLPQPTVSRHVRDLEGALGATLLERSSRATTPTGAGEAALDHARGVLERLDRMREAVAAAQRRDRGEVTVAFISSTVNALLAPLVQRAAVEHPAIEINVAQLRIADVVARVRDGSVDLAITRPIRPRSELVERTLLVEPVHAVLGVDHPLAGHAEIDLAQLADEPWILLEPAIWPAGHERLLAHVAERGIAIRAARHASSHAAAVALVAAGAGFYRLPASAAIAHDGVAYVPLVAMESQVVALHRPGPMAPPLRAVLETAGELALS